MTPLAFLEWLGGPAVIRVSGRSGGPARAASVLLHGNEPSGLVALHRLLATGLTPAVDLVCTVGAVEAALLGDGFRHRQPPGRRDLNRCFTPPYDDPDSRLAWRLLSVLREAKCETLVDLHNNSGQNPAYGVLTVVDPERLRLISLFSERAVHTDIRLGTMLEATEETITGVSIECGLAGDPEADEVAFEGLKRYAETERLDAIPETDVELYDCPVRLCLRPEAVVAFGDEPNPAATVTLRGNIDQHNFEPLPEGLILGWLNNGDWPFEAIDQDGRDVSHEILADANGELTVRDNGGTVIPIMMTTDAGIAHQDCVCYFVRPAKP